MLQAALFVGGQVTESQEVMLREAIDIEKFDQTLAEQATKRGIDTYKPFMFSVECKSQKVQQKLINGACHIE